MFVIGPVSHMLYNHKLSPMLCASQTLRHIRARAIGISSHTITAGEAFGTFDILQMLTAPVTCGIALGIAYDLFFQNICMLAPYRRWLTRILFDGHPPPFAHLSKVTVPNCVNKEGLHRLHWGGMHYCCPLDNSKVNTRTKIRREQGKHLLVWIR